MTDGCVARFEELRKTDKQWRQKTVAQKHAKHAEAAQEVMGPVTDAVVPHFAPKVPSKLQLQWGWRAGVNPLLSGLGGHVSTFLHHFLEPHHV